VGGWVVGRCIRAAFVGGLGGCVCVAKIRCHDLPIIMCVI